MQGADAQPGGGHGAAPVVLAECTEGRDGSDFDGCPCIILTTDGAMSGKLRKTPLIRVEHEGEYAVVASMGGAPSHPVWYHNVFAHPLVMLHDRAVARGCPPPEPPGAQTDRWRAPARGTHAGGAPVSADCSRGAR